MDVIKYYLTHPKDLFGKVLQIVSPVISDRTYLKIRYCISFGKKLNLNNPVLFQEKLQWLKLNDRKPVYHQMVDKYEAKTYIKERVGEQYCIPTIGLWNSFDDIDFDSLPDKFIIKGTFDSGNYYICMDKSKLDIKLCRKRVLADWYGDYYYKSREWPYKGLKHRIIAEPLLEDKECPYLRDFKFYCFHGEPKLFYITSDKGGGLPTRQDFFDTQGNHLELQDIHYLNNPVRTPDLPKKLDEMLDVCRKLAKDTCHLRVDLYEVNGNIYCGELTFFEGGGFCRFTPEEWNRKLGDWIRLPL